MRNLFSEPFIQAICWTLLHSLWIGVITAALSGLVISFTRKSSAGLRYRLLCGNLVLFMLMVGCVFFKQLPQAAIYTTTGGMLPFTANSNIHAISQDLRSAGFVAFINQHTGLLVGLWLLVFMIKTGRMASGLLFLAKLRKRKLHPVTAALTGKLAGFSARLGIQQRVSLFQSELVKVPVTLGLFKPVILLPFGILMQLSPEQVESILWHELAHISRRDYLVNMFQHIAEAIFFFNPALLWLSALINEEREACCDEIALKHSHKISYLEALLTFSAIAPKLALAFGGRNPLRNRLKRMIQQENQRLNFPEKVVLLAGIAVLMAFTIIPKTKTFSLAIKPKASVVLKKKSFAVPVRRRKAAPDQIAAFKSKQYPNYKKDTTGTKKPSRGPDADLNYDKQRTRAIIAALVREKVVANPSALSWFGLDAGQLVVNGQKQPEGLHQQLVAAYHIEPGHGIYYGSVQVTGTGTFLDKADLQ